MGAAYRGGHPVKILPDNNKTNSANALTTIFF